MSKVLSAAHRDVGATNEVLLQDPAKPADAMPKSNPCDPGRSSPPRTWVPVAFREELVLAIVMAILAGITLLNVITRYFTNYSFAFTEEYSILLLFVMVLVGTSAAAVKNQHLKMTFFTDLLSMRWRKIAEAVGLLAMALCFGVLVYYGYRLTFDAYELDETTPGLGNPQWLYLMWLPILSGIILLRTIGALLRLARSFAKEAE